MKKEQTKYLVIVIALLAVLWFFGHEWGARVLKDFSIGGATSTPVAVEPVATSTPSSPKTPIEEAWQTFALYRTYAKNHDLTGLASVTYKLSPTCAAALLGDQGKLKNCQTMMDGVTLFSKNFQRSDFTQTLSDDKQIVIATGYIDNEAQKATIKTVLYFVRGNSAKLAGIRICLDKDQASNECNINKTDSNHNGWWDDVEFFFNQNQ